MHFGGNEVAYLACPLSFIHSISYLTHAEHNASEAWHDGVPEIHCCDIMDGQDRFTLSWPR